MLITRGLSSNTQKGLLTGGLRSLPHDRRLFCAPLASIALLSYPCFNSILFSAPQAVPARLDSPTSSFALVQSVETKDGLALRVFGKAILPCKSFANIKITLLPLPCSTSVSLTGAEAEGSVLLGINLEKAVSIPEIIVDTKALKNLDGSTGGCC